MVFYYSATENTSNSMVFCCVAKLCRESRPFLVQFYVANHAVLVAHFNPKTSAGWHTKKFKRSDLYQQGGLYFWFIIINWSRLGLFKYTDSVKFKSNRSQIKFYLTKFDHSNILSKKYLIRFEIQIKNLKIYLIWFEIQIRYLELHLIWFEIQIKYLKVYLNCFEIQIRYLELHLIWFEIQIRQSKLIWFNLKFK